MATRDDILKMSNGEREAFERVYKASWNKVYMFTGFFLKDEKEREDVVQDVFVKLWLKRNAINLDDDYDGFLFILTKNLIVDRLRRKGASVKIETLDGCVEVKLPEVEEGIDAEILRKRVHLIIQLLPPCLVTGEAAGTAAALAASSSSHDVHSVDVTDLRHILRTHGAYFL